MLEAAELAEIEAIRTAVCLIFAGLPTEAQAHVLDGLKATATTYIQLSQTNPPEKAMIGIQFAGAMEDLRERLVKR